MPDGFPAKGGDGSRIRVLLLDGLELRLAARDRRGAIYGPCPAEPGKPGPARRERLRLWLDSLGNTNRGTVPSAQRADALLFGSSRLILVDRLSRD